MCFPYIVRLPTPYLVDLGKRRRQGMIKCECILFWQKKLLQDLIPQNRNIVKCYKDRVGSGLILLLKSDLVNSVKDNFSQFPLQA